MDHTTGNPARAKPKKANTMKIKTMAGVSQAVLTPLSA
jgi:hypothetical protein